MANIMTYSELSDICDAKRILIKSVAESSGLTYDGLRNGMVKQSLGMTKVLRICETGGITPNSGGTKKKQHITLTRLVW